ncbi:FliO/MopB family protein [Desulfofalx alkaliphila]|uniref:FliO/MopB family protein n=1 Tax=Desulfofalx alkaliphila TaxID=105483 RepID=UPI00068F942F|nr:flagellar biosynthetic protein FliO [Desulfofalx alkaliphila]
MDDKDILFAFIRTLIALPLVVLLAYLVIKYGLARRGMVQRGPGGRRMRVLEQIPLGAKAMISLVELGGRYYLFSHSETEIKLLKEFDSLPGVIDESGGFVENIPDFRQILKGKFGKGTGGDSGGEN